MWADVGTATEDRVQVEPGVSGVGCCGGVGHHTQRGLGVEGDIVVDELAEERRPRSHVRHQLVGVVRAQLRVGDQPDRALVQRVLGVEQTTQLADVVHRILDRCRRGVGECGKREHPAESWIGGGGDFRTFDLFSECFDVAEDDGAGDTCPDTADEAAAAELWCVISLGDANCQQIKVCRSEPI